MDTGWIRLHRSMVDWGWYTDTNTKVVFLHLLLTANWRDREYRGHPVKVGDVIVGTMALASELGMTRQQVRTALEHLQSTGEITIKSTNKFSIVTINNWSKYQLDEATNKITNNQPTESLDAQGFQEIGETQVTNKITNNQPTSNQQITTPKEYKNKEYNNISIVIDIWNSICVDFPKVIKATKNSTRYKTIKARWNEYGEDGIRETFEKVQASTFLKGESESGWQATFDWVMKASNFMKVREGNYDNKIKRHTDDHGTEWDNILFG